MQNKDKRCIKFFEILGCQLLTGLQSSFQLRFSLRESLTTALVDRNEPFSSLPPPIPSPPSFSRNQEKFSRVLDPLASSCSQLFISFPPHFCTDLAQGLWLALGEGPGFTGLFAYDTPLSSYWRSSTNSVPSHPVTELTRRLPAVRNLGDKLNLPGDSRRPRRP